jgi:hypothetical protein
VNATTATAATALTVRRVFSVTIVNMTFSLSFAAGPLPAFLNSAHRSDSVMCSSGVVVNYNTDKNASLFWLC